jgi:hypothetical protein
MSDYKTSILPNDIRDFTADSARAYTICYLLDLVKECSSQGGCEVELVSPGRLSDEIVHELVKRGFGVKQPYEGNSGFIVW